MIIGILTHPLKTNYGGILQAFALQKVLKNMGHDAYTINRFSKSGYKSFLHHLTNYIKRLKEFFIDKKDVSIQWNHLITDEEYQIISQHTQNFINRNIKTTRKICNDELENIDQEYLFDAYVVGSDQVWLPQYCPNSFLDFVNRINVIKIFYAASCGKESFAINKNLKEKCKILAKSFQGISVREDFLLNLSENVLGRTAVLVLDPTMLLTPNDYLKVVIRTRNLQPIVFSYFLDRNDIKLKMAQSISEKLHLPIEEGNVCAYYKNRNKRNFNDCIYPSVDSWIEKLNSSKFVITDSFHGTVFAILFNKPFVTIGNKDRGMERFISLLKIFNLQSRLITNVDSLIKIIETPIDFTLVNKKLFSMRNYSLTFLQNELKR